MSDLPSEPGDTLVPVQLSPCVGGLVRTWAEHGSRLWSVREAAALAAVQGTGLLARTPRGEQRFREVTLLHESTGRLVLEPRDPAQPDGAALPVTTISLEPAGAAGSEAPQDFRRAINQAVRHVASTFEYLVIEVGGWEAPYEPYAFFALHVDESGRQLSTIEVSPAPTGSELWRPHVRRGAPGASVSAPVSAEAIDMAAYYLADAVVALELLPWDVALTFGVRPTD